MDAHGTLDLTLAPEPGSVAEARTKVCDAVDPKLADGDADTLRLLVSEVVTNAVRHGDGDTPRGGPRELELGGPRRGLRPAATASRPRRGSAPLDEPGGFGLFLVGRLADRWGVETTSGTTVWFVIQRH